MDKDIIILIINAVIVPFIMWGLAELSAFIRAKTKQVYVSGFISRAEDYITVAVKEAAQTYVDNIKGTDKWTPETQKEAFDRAFRRATALLGANGMVELEKLVSDAEGWITAQIEATISNSKPWPNLP